MTEISTPIPESAFGDQYFIALKIIKIYVAEKETSFITGVSLTPHVPIIATIICDLKSIRSLEEYLEVSMDFGESKYRLALS